MSHPAQTETVPAATFDAEAAAILQELRPALGGIIDALAPAPPHPNPITRPTDLHRLLKLDQTLSWSIFNAATADDTRTIPSLLPGRRAMERFFSAAAQHGVPATAIDRARAAFERFEQTVATHAGSRAAFEAMLSGESASSDAAARAAAADHKHKRAAFRALSILWGRQARVFYGAVAVHPTAPDAQDNSLLDRLIVKGVIGLHRTRRGVPLHTLVHYRHKPTPGDPTRHIPLQPVDPRERDAGEGSVGLLQDFCSQPLPLFRPCAPNDGESADGAITHELIADGVGQAAEVSYFTAHIGRASTARPGSIPGAELTLAKVVDIPIAVYIGDILMHESVWDETLPSVRVYGAQRPESPWTYSDSQLLPLTERAVYLGCGIDSGRTPLIPRYADMLSWSLRQAGWNPAEFRIFRCRVDFPILSSRIRMTFR